MTYELAKELKDAGFQLSHSYYDANQFCIRCHKHILPEESCIPTLSELIEACGEGMHALIIGKPFMTSGCTQDDEGAMTLNEKGDTPSEAVARLWLALNKK